MGNCIKCGIEKTIQNTSKDNSSKDGLNHYCRDCQKKLHKQWYERNKKEINDRRFKKRQENIEAVRAYNRKWRENNKDKIKETNRLRRLENPEKVRAESAKSQQKCKKHRNEYKKRWRAKNKDKIKNAIPINQRISMVISSNIRRCLYGNKNGWHWEEIVGYVLKDLICHLEKQFTEGMAWDNYGKHGWHIEHKIPISVHNFTKPEHEDFKRCWALVNLQPMWAKENLKKGNKIKYHFQPSLLI